jgi:hypothetical protein
MAVEQISRRHNRRARKTQRNDGPDKSAAGSIAQLTETTRPEAIPPIGSSLLKPHSAALKGHRRAWVDQHQSLDFSGPDAALNCQSR